MGLLLRDQRLGLLLVLEELGVGAELRRVERCPGPRRAVWFTVPLAFCSSLFTCSAAARASLRIRSLFCSASFLSRMTFSYSGLKWCSPRITCRTITPSGSSTAASLSRASAAFAKRFSET